MVEPGIEHTTALLGRLAQGDVQAQGQLYSEVCAELRRVAGALMQGQPAGHTLQPTALVNEAWIRLVSGAGRTYENRGHFLCVAAKAMRTVLVDHVRAKRTRKRGGGRAALGLDEAVAQLEAGNTDLIDLDEAMVELDRDDPELARVVELLFFGGLSQPEAAEVLGVSVPTVQRGWRLARARLHRRMGRPEVAGDGME